MKKLTKYEIITLSIGAILLIVLVVLLSGVCDNRIASFLLSN